MKASETYEFVKSLVRKAELDLDTGTFVNALKELDWQISGEFSYMRMDVQKVESDGCRVRLYYKSYDPSGPFQNLPDVNKIQVQLIQGNTVIDELNVRFDG
ncbi:MULTISPECIES: hypothetical protein [Motilimonas]|uniref:Uncharacterized protein n=1 Tax=Motilimonas cestriensis TaxID=2742685 RepID=A0ABS8WF99_9GAMM|nr:MULTISPECIES: hypothetical protein [Motilimonas]MCE2596391.1 hypothetical protein [Motilimonas cestriensis]MDO6528175.1 hypothetical protein [Motilimonas sp. 1_MG-2023]